MRVAVLFGVLGIFLLDGCIALTTKNNGGGGGGAGGNDQGGAAGAGGLGGAGGGVMGPTWSRRYGDANPQSVRSVAVADDGSVYVTGGFNGTIEFGDMDAATGHKLVCNEAAVPCPYLMRLDAVGNPIWVKTVTAGAMVGTCSAGTGTAVTTVGNDVIWAGNVPGDVMQPGGATNVFVQRISAAGISSKPVYFGGAGEDRLNAMVYDGGNLYLAGTITTLLMGVASEVPCAKSGFTTTTDGVPHLLAFSIGATDLTCQWGQVFGDGEHPTESISIGVKPGENVFISGDYKNGTIAGLPTLAGVDNGAFVLELTRASGVITTTASTFASSNPAGGECADCFISMRSLQVADGTVYVAGKLSGAVRTSDMAMTVLNPGGVVDGTGNAFVLALNDTDLSKKWLDVFTGSKEQVASGLAVRGSEVFLTGTTSGPMAAIPNGSMNTTMCADNKTCIFYFRLRATDGNVFDGKDTAQYSNNVPGAPNHAINNAVIAVNGNARAIAASAAGPINMTPGDDKANDLNADDEPDLVIGHWPAPPPVSSSSLNECYPRMRLVTSRMRPIACRPRK